jgi:glutamate dehydrogenase/leucine dehydrogenase
MASVEEAGLHDHLEWDTPLYRTAIAQFDQAIPYANVPVDIAERLRHPERAFIVSCPVRLDDGRRRRAGARGVALSDRVRPPTPAQARRAIE